MTANCPATRFEFGIRNSEFGISQPATPFLLFSSSPFLAFRDAEGQPAQ